MLRAVVSILLILQLLVSPGRCFAHCHPEHSAEESHQHASRPHLHFGDHGHNHGHCHGDHRDHDQHRSPALPQHRESGETPLSPTDGDTTPHPTSTTCDTHDSTAIYFAVDAVWLAVSPADAKSLFANTLLSPLDGRCLTPLPARCATGHAPAPRIEHTDCPLYLRKLSLRL